MFGVRIAALRKEKGLSQSELAERLQISPSAVGMYEQGRREPSAALLVAIARELGVTTDYLLTGIPGKQGDRDVFKKLLEQTLLLTDEAPGNRRSCPLTKQELAVLLLAMLTEP